MIIHDFNQPMPNALKHELRDSVMVDENIYPHKDLPNPIYSTFSKSNEPHFPLNVERFYFDWIGKILDDLGLMGRVGVISSKWCQVYNNDMGVESTTRDTSADSIQNSLMKINTRISDLTRRSQTTTRRSLSSIDTVSQKTDNVFGAKVILMTQDIYATEE